MTNECLKVTVGITAIMSITLVINIIVSNSVVYNIFYSGLPYIAN